MYPGWEHALLILAYHTVTLAHKKASQKDSTSTQYAVHVLGSTTGLWVCTYTPLGAWLLIICTLTKHQTRYKRHAPVHVNVHIRSTCYSRFTHLHTRTHTHAHTSQNYAVTQCIVLATILPSQHHHQKPHTHTHTVSSLQARKGRTRSSLLGQWQRQPRFQVPLHNTHIVVHAVTTTCTRTFFFCVPFLLVPLTR